MATLKDRAWHGRIDAERQHRYFIAIKEKYRRRFHWTAITVAASSVMSGTLTLIARTSDASWADLVSPAFSFIAGLSIAFLLRNNDARIVAKAESASEYFAMMVRDWRHVWVNMHDPRRAESIRLLEERMANAPDVDVGVDSKLNQRCYEEAIDVAMHDYAPAAT